MRAAYIRPLKNGVTFWLALSLSACAYRFGLSERSLPGGYRQVAIPVFKNSSADVGIEISFTNALIRRFARSNVATVVDKESAPVVLEGLIKEIKTIAGSSAATTSLPAGAVLFTDYRLLVTVDMALRRKSDDKILWTGSFRNEQAVQAPRVGAAVLNSANATYNHNIRIEKIALAADETMSEAHDRMTENF